MTKVLVIVDIRKLSTFVLLTTVGRETLARENANILRNRSALFCTVSSNWESRTGLVTTIARHREDYIPDHSAVQIQVIGLSAAYTKRLVFSHDALQIQR